MQVLLCIACFRLSISKSQKQSSKLIVFYDSINSNAYVIFILPDDKIEVVSTLTIAPTIVLEPFLKVLQNFLGKNFDLSCSSFALSLTLRYWVSQIHMDRLGLYLACRVDFRSCCLGSGCEYITYFDDLASEINLSAFGKFVTINEGRIVSDLEWTVLGAKRQRKNIAVG